MPPAEKESGVTFSIPMTSAGRGKTNSNWQAFSSTKIRGLRPSTSGRSSVFALRPSAFFQPSTLALRPSDLLVSCLRTRHLNELNLVALWRINESNPAAVGFHVRAVRIFQAELLQMFSEILQAVYLEGQVG